MVRWGDDGMILQEDVEKVADKEKMGGMNRKGMERLGREEKEG